MRSGLIRKFAAIMMALALLPVALLGLQLINISRRGIQAAVLELHTKLAETLAEKVDDYLSASHQKVAFALASLQKTMNWSEKQELLRSLIETHDDIVEISLVDRRGVEIVKVYNPDFATEASLVSRAADPAFQQYRAQARRVSAVGENGGAPALVIYYPIKPDVGARVVVSLATLARRIAAERLGGTGFAVLVDAQGKPLLLEPGRLDEGSLASFPTWSMVSASVQSHSVGSSEFSDAGGKRYVGAYAPVGIGGAIVTLQSHAEAYHAADRMKKTAAGAILLVIVIAALAATWLARALTRPIFALTSAAEAVSRGDFLVKVGIHTGDELQELAQTFNRMTAQLHAYSELQVDRLIAEQRKTEAILYSINDGIVMSDKEGRVQLANRRALELFGLNPQLSVEGRTFFDALPESGLREAVVAAAGAPDPEGFKEVDLSTDQQRRYVRVSAHPVRRPESGDDIGIIVSLRDVTLERELDKMKEEFLHYVTHDLRNPLGSAMGFLDILLRGTPGVLNPDQHGIVSSVKRSTMRLMAMVNNILDIAKMESGRLKLQLKTVSITGVAGRSIGTLESLSNVKKITVALEAAEEFSVEADADHIERVFTNLLGNAIKYTPNGGAIAISIAEDGDGLKCCVQDSGEGIPDEFRERIFQKFEQVTGQRRGGTGLGLTISRFFVEAHLGRIWVESEIGKGSRFFFTIPRGLALDARGDVTLSARVA